MVAFDTHCHALPYWFEPVEILLDQMARNDVDKVEIPGLSGSCSHGLLLS